MIIFFRANKTKQKVVLQTEVAQLLNVSHSDLHFHVFIQFLFFFIISEFCSYLAVLALDPSLHFLAAQGEVAKIKEEIDKGIIYSQFIT